MSNRLVEPKAAPLTQADYLAADHATVVYEPHRSLDLDQQLLARGVKVSEIFHGDDNVHTGTDDRQRSMA